MRARQIATWQAVAERASARLQFALTLTDEARSVTFIERADASPSGVQGRVGLLTDLAGIRFQLDPRSRLGSFPALPEIRLDAEALERELGAVPKHPGAYRCELALVVEGLAWSDRLVLVSGAPVDEQTVRHDVGGVVALSLRDPLDSGRVRLPQELVRLDRLPASWTAANLVPSANGAPFPICYGDIKRAQPLKAYELSGAVSPAIYRRYLLAGHRVTGANATVYFASEYLGAYSSGTLSIQHDVTTDGITFAYVETTQAVAPGANEENPAGTPPKIVDAVDFEATDGDRATMGGLVRDLVSRWSDVPWDEAIERSMADLVAGLRPMLIDAVINGQGVDRARLRDLIDGRFAQQAPFATARFGGRLFLLSLAHLMREPGPAYHQPATELRLGSDCHLTGEIVETGPVLNDFEARYGQREDGAWTGALWVGPETDFECERSRSHYGRRESPSMDLHDVSDQASAGFLLRFLRDLHVWPWYEATVSCPLGMAWLLPGQKVRLQTVGEPRIATHCRRHRHNLDHGTDWRDAIVTSIEFRRIDLLLRVIF